MSAAPELLDFAPLARPRRARFDGSEVARNAANEAKLNRKLRAVYDCLRNGEWWSVSDLAFMTYQSQPATQAQCRNLRKARFGGFNVVGKRFLDGVYRYQLQPGAWAARSAPDYRRLLRDVLALFGPCRCGEPQCPVCRAAEALGDSR